MVLAHTLGAGGPEIELLFVAAAFVVLGIVFFIQKTAKPAVAVGILVAGVALGASAFALGGSDAPSGERISVEITAPANGAEVPAGDKFALEVDLEGASLADDSDDEDSEAGHLHIFVDDEIVDMPTTLTPDVELEEGDHTITVEYTTADHQQLSPRVLDEIEVSAR